MLSIIITTYERPQLFLKCLEGAMQVMDAMDAETIVVNDSKIQSVTVPTHPKIKLFNNPGKGLASARNYGAFKAAGELILFVDDDIEFNLKNVQGLLDLYNAKDPACYNPNWRYSDAMRTEIEKTKFGRFLINCGLINYKGWVPDIDWQDHVFAAKKLAGFFMLMPKQFFDDIGRFNETFVNQGIEDDDLCKRLDASGIKMYVDPNNYVFHNEMDRVTLESRARRFYAGAVNRRKALDMGDLTYKITYSASKKILLKMVLPFEPLLFFIARCIPNRKSFDFLYFKISHVIIATSIYKGYMKFVA